MYYPDEPSEYLAQTKAQFERVYPVLVELYPEPYCALTHRNPFELLVATILSAQCTDERVNMTTPALFAKFPTPQAMAAAPVEDIERLIASVGLYRAKSRNLSAMSKLLVERFGGEVPRTLEEIITLPGAARKTANVVLGNAFQIQSGIAVDTHVTRLVGRIGLSRQTQPPKIEQELMQIVPQAEWTNVSHRLIEHGRQVCQARKPACDRCAIADLCPKIGVVSG